MEIFSLTGCILISMYKYKQRHLPCDFPTCKQFRHIFVRLQTGIRFRAARHKMRKNFCLLQHEIESRCLSRMVRQI